MSISKKEARAIINRRLAARECKVPRHESYVDYANAVYALLHGEYGRFTTSRLAVKYIRNLAMRYEPKAGKKRGALRASSSAFLRSEEWRRVRYRVLKKYGARCMCCGMSRMDGVAIHVDHIKPRSLFPELALDENNLQVLCEDCNLGKSNTDETDWRPVPEGFPDLDAEFRRKLETT